MMYFSSLNLKQHNQNTAVGTHSGPRACLANILKGKSAHPLARVHSNMAAASLPGCYGDIPITSMLSILQTCLRQVKVLPMMVRTPVASRKSHGAAALGISVQQAREADENESTHWVKLHRMPSNGQGPKRPSYFHRLAGKTFKSTRQLE